jgi:DNA-binding transcriptional LysR family regulator
MEDQTMRWDARIGKRLKLHDLNVFLAVVQAGSMGKAASRLAVSQPAVSKAITDMERVLGVRLFDRTPQGVEPTRYGRALIKRGIAIFDELKQGVSEIEFLADPTKGELRVGAAEPVAAAMVSAAIERLSRQYPRLIFQVLPGYTSTLYRDLEQRNVELVVTRTFEPIHKEQLNNEILCNDTHVVVSGIKNKWASRRCIKLRDLLNEPWCLHPLDSPHGALIAESFRAAGLAVPAATVFAFSLPLREALVGRGRFLTTLPGFLMRSPVRHPWFKALPVELPETQRPISILTLRNRTLSPMAELFMAEVRTVAKELARPGDGPVNTASLGT